MKANIKTKLQEVYFDICDLLEGEIPSGYKNENEVYKDIKDKLEEIEEALKTQNTERNYTI